MTTEAWGCTLPVGLAALQNPLHWTGRAVKCWKPVPRPDDRYRTQEALCLMMMGRSGGKVGIPAGPVTIRKMPLGVFFWLAEKVPEGWIGVGMWWRFISDWTPTRETLLAALSARWAAIEGDHATVDNFTRDILGHTRPERWRDAVTSMLLGDWVDRLGSYLTDPELLEILRANTAAERRRWTPLWDRKTGGFRWRGPNGVVRERSAERVWLLETPNRDGVTLRDVLPDRAAADALTLDRCLANRRIDAVFRSLDAMEASVASLWAIRKGSWADAALDLGLAAEVGDRVRRKLSRIGDQHTERALAAAVTR
ncbi:hypothetical protein ACIQI7_32175 [Kitasatospora sp. NPDC092039]|uniref:hypothetical protein n=1 Tax=Kitasatospora sp. NPDC092039 TaxID=3364086 RepID=UPI0037F9D0DA